MTSVQRIDPSGPFDAQLATASPDLLREMLSSFVHTIMNAEADTLCGAGYGERSEERVNSRNGYRHREFDTRLGTIDIAVPKLRQGSSQPAIGHNPPPIRANRGSPFGDKEGV